MRTFIFLVAVVAIALLSESGPAPAKGCGRVAGHHAGHHGFHAVARCVGARDRASGRKAAQTNGQGISDPKQIDAQGPDREDLANPP